MKAALSPAATTARPRDRRGEDRYVATLTDPVQAGHAVGRDSVGGGGTTRLGRLFDGLTGACGVGLIAAPWLLGFASSSRAAAAAVAVGATVVALAAWALSAPVARLPRRLVLVATFLLYLSPWLVGYRAVPGAADTAWFMSTVTFGVAIASVVEARGARRSSSNEAPVTRTP
jgi:hypothetical protein